MTKKDDDKELETQADESTPAGSESTPAAKGSEAPAEETKQPEYEKTKQQLDQERANRKRLQTNLEETQVRLEERETQLAQMQTQIAELQKQVQTQLTKKDYENLESLDPDTTDVPEAVKALQKLTAKVQQQQDTITNLQEHISRQQAKEREQAQTQARNEVEEEIYSACDEEFGAQYRNEAIQLADRWVDDGEIEAPRTQVQGLRLLRKCYAEVAKKHVRPKDDKKPAVPTDTGLRGLGVHEIGDSDEFKPGTYEQVAADIAKKQKAGKWRKAFAGSS